MREIIDYLFDRLQSHWIQIVVAAGFTIVGWFLARWRSRRDWQRREFFDRLNISLNILRDGKLQIRTLLEKRCEDVFLNAAAARTVIQLAQRTTAADPLLPFSREDNWDFLNAILNEVSEKFAAGLIRRDLGASVVQGTYLICLTCEAAGQLRQRKIRAMVIQQQVLENLPEQIPQFESPHHTTRWDTLQKLSKSWRQTPERFLKMEICW